MNVLILGSGGREHALAWKIAQSSMLNQLYIAPGNPGTAEIGTNIPLDINDFDAVAQIVKEKEIRVLLVGPEQPLVNGIADYFNEREEFKKVLVIGPGRKGAQLEGSKAFAKQFMQKHKIPTAAYGSFTKQDLPAAYKFLEGLKPPYVLKADGLAAGKGVLIINSLAEAKTQLAQMFEGMFGAASDTVVIEAFLKGIEMSVFVLTDGKAYKVLPEAKDYKRIGVGDTGPNTGGMGAVSPVPFAKSDLMDKIHDRIIAPTIRGLQDDDIPYIGFIFIGLMIVKDEPFVIEYNVRMGDPETEVVMPRLQSDLLDMFEGIIGNTLSERHVEMDERVAATVMLVSGGYPGDYEKGKVIRGIENTDGVTVFHAGTAVNKKGELTTNGGRVLAVTALARDLDKALNKAFENAEKISFDGMYYRSDIGADIKKAPQKP
jgi:phosphoribosylamine---glycine ligase